MGKSGREGVKPGSSIILYIQMTHESHQMETLLSAEVIEFDKCNPKLRSRKQI